MKKKKCEWKFEIDFTQKDFNSSIRFKNKLFCIIHYILLYVDKFLLKLNFFCI